MEKEHIAVELTREAKDNRFIDSEIHGGLKIAGSGNQFVRTGVYKFKKEHPFFFWLAVVASIITILSFLGTVFSKDKYVGFYYPDANNLLSDIQSPEAFDSLEMCRDWVDKQVFKYNPDSTGYDYECGKNCDTSGGKPYICEETLE